MFVVGAEIKTIELPNQRCPNGFGNFRRVK